MAAHRRIKELETAVLEEVIAAVMQTPIPDKQPCRHLGDALRAVVRIGNDTDTVAAIEGSLLGARWGASAVPLAWRRLMHGWPGYHSRDLVRPAVLAAEKGKVGHDNWPVVEDLGPYYEAQFHSTPWRWPFPTTTV